MSFLNSIAAATKSPFQPVAPRPHADPAIPHDCAHEPAPAAKKPGGSSTHNTLDSVASDVKKVTSPAATLLNAPRQLVKAEQTVGKAGNFLQSSGLKSLSSKLGGKADDMMGSKLGNFLVKNGDDAGKWEGKMAGFVPGLNAATAAASTYQSGKEAVNYFKHGQTTDGVIESAHTLTNAARVVPEVGPMIATGGDVAAAGAHYINHGGLGKIDSAIQDMGTAGKFIPGLGRASAAYHSGKDTVNDFKNGHIGDGAIDAFHTMSNAAGATPFGAPIGWMGDGAAAGAHKALDFGHSAVNTMSDVGGAALDTGGKALHEVSDLASKANPMNLFH